jgi:hypothetical protein
MNSDFGAPTSTVALSTLKAGVSGLSTSVARLSELSTLTLKARFRSFRGFFVRGFLPTEKRSFSNSRS